MAFNSKLQSSLQAPQVPPNSSLLLSPSSKLSLALSNLDKWVNNGRGEGLSDLVPSPSLPFLSLSIFRSSPPSLRRMAFFRRRRECFLRGGAIRRNHSATAPLLKKSLLERSLPTTLPLKKSLPTTPLIAPSKIGNKIFLKGPCS